MTTQSSRLFEIARTEPRPDLFLCFLSGRLSVTDEATAKIIVDAYNDWTVWYGISRKDS